MATRTIKSTGFFPGYSTFLNAIHSANLSIWDHYAETFFNGDLDRIIYSSSDYAFKKRAKTQTNNSLNLPFMNFKIAPNGISNGGQRNWWNMALNVMGQYNSTLKAKIKLQPIEIDYDAKLYVHTESDLQYGFSLIAWDDSNETILTPTLEKEVDSETHTLENIGVLRYGFGFQTDYNEKDWLEMNKIKVIDLNMSLETFLVRANTSGFCVPKTFIMDFASRKGDIDELEDYDQVYQAVINHVLETTGDLEEQ